MNCANSDQLRCVVPLCAKREDRSRLRVCARQALMFEKIIEVLSNSDFKLVETSKSKFEILAISKITFKSWGENLYISFETSGNETTMKFCSVTIFQIYSWGKNEKNYTDLLNEIENSIII